MANKIKITSYTYEIGDKKFKAKIFKPRTRSRGLSLNDAGQNCEAGAERCVNGKLHRCLPIDNEGTCIWFVTNEDC